MWSKLQRCGSRDEKNAKKAKASKPGSKKAQLEKTLPMEEVKENNGTELLLLDEDAWGLGWADSSST